MEIYSVDQAKTKLAELERICKTRPSVAHAADLAATYFTLGDAERALPLMKMVYDKHKEFGIGTNLAMVYKDLGMHEESLKIIEEAYWNNPDDFYTKLAYAEGLLKAGHWQKAWPIYDNARPTQAMAAMELNLPASVKEWRDDPLPEGHTLLVINEGGTGDRISYARWLNTLTERGVNWKFYPYRELFSFFERIFPRDRLVADEDDINPTHWTTTFALPARLTAAPTDIPRPVPLTALPEMVAKYKFERHNKLPVIGICYEAAEAFQGGRKVRSLSEGQAMRLICQVGNDATWVSLQHKKKMPYPVSNIEFDTWEEMVGLIANLDYVVTVDTAVYHIAGAMGKKMALVLSANSCWKFLRTGVQDRWYPNCKIFRNKTVGMEDALTQLAVEIKSGAAWT